MCLGFSVQARPSDLAPADLAGQTLRVKLLCRAMQAEHDAHARSYTDSLMSYLDARGCLQRRPATSLALGYELWPFLTGPPAVLFYSNQSSTDAYHCDLIVTARRVHIGRYQPLPSRTSALEIHCKVRRRRPRPLAEILVLEVAGVVAERETDTGCEGIDGADESGTG